MKDFNKITILSFLFCFLLSVSLQAQKSIEGKNAVQLLRVAKNAERTGDIYLAINCYEKYLLKKPKDLKTQYKLAHQYRLARDYTKARLSYKQVFDEESEKYPLAQYYYALMLMTDYKYDEAKKNLEEFKRGPYREELKNDDYLRRTVRDKIESCEFATIAIDSTIDIRIKHFETPINKAHLESSPVPIDKNSFLFSSFRADSVIFYKDDDSTKMSGLRKIYKAERTKSGWEIKPFDKEINSTEEHTVNGTLSPDGGRFYFNRCYKNWQQKIICDIYVSYKKNNNWQKPLKVEELSIPDYTSSQPTVGNYSKNDAEVIYFVSDRPGGRGGMDIWYALFDKKNNRFKEPKNLGGKINSKGDEATPFYDIDTRTLYYSSDGHPGFGNLDVFKSVGELRKWLAPENIGHPVNTGADDLSYILFNKGQEGYFTSNRPGGTALKNETCCDDIYYFSYKKPQYTKINGKLYALEDNFLKTFIERKLGMNLDSLKSIEGTTISLFMKDPESGEPIFIKTDTVGKTGEYSFDVLKNKDFELIVENLGHFNKKIEFTTKGNPNDSLTINPIGVNVVTKKPIKLNIYYDFGKSTIKEESKLAIDTTLLSIMKEAPQVILQISSHTDSKGNDDFNKELSQKRAENVVKYLTKKGIDKNRLIAKGYGEEQPVAPNTNPDGSDNPEGRQKNRRTEFQIVGSIEEYRRNVDNE